MNTVQEGIQALQLGEMIIVVDDEDRENEGDLVMIAEKVTPEAINFMAKYGRGLICAPVEPSLAQQLDLPPMVESEDKTCNFAVTIDSRFGITTGISAEDRAKTIMDMVADDARPEQFVRPGHIFPLLARDGGVLVRTGHTEASVDLSKLAGYKGAGVICEICNDDGTMARMDDLEKFAKEHNLKMITIADLVQYRREKTDLVEFVSEAPLNTKYGKFNIKVFKDRMTGDEHAAFVKGDVHSDSTPPLVRVHSECLTGDIFGSCRCDCGAQLDAAMKQIEEEGEGILLYMRKQEGRGIGLGNKIKAYELQDQGYDTVEANVKLGFAPDLRDYGIGAQILKHLGISDMRLLTNNPKKISGIEGYGLNIIEQVPIRVGRHDGNTDYLDVKRDKMGHDL